MAVGLVRTVFLNPGILDRLEVRQNEIELERGKYMAMTFIKKSTLPVLGRGKSTGPSVTITDKGQLTFNPAASKAFGDLKLAVVGFDTESRKLQINAFAKPPKGFTEEDCYQIGTQAKSKSSYFSCANLLQSKEYNIGYDYKKSGSQNFVPTMDADKHVIMITLPEGALTPKPKQGRKAKQKGPVVVEAPKVAAAGANGMLGLEEVEP